MRTLITVSQETIDNAVAQTDSADMLLDAAEQRIYDIRQGKGKGNLLKSPANRDSGTMYRPLQNP